MAYWASDPLWQSLSGPQRAAAMALLEAEVGQAGINVDNARNALGAIINRAESEGQSLGEHASRKIYQPIIEDNQRARLPTILQSPEFQQLSELAAQRASGAVPDWVGGADHYLAPPQTMLALEAKEPNKYKSWRSWTQFDPETNQYGNVVMTDESHHFLDLLDNNGKSAPSSQPTQTAAPTARKDKSMLPFLAQLLGMSGPAAAAAGSSAAGATIPALSSAPAATGAQAAGQGGGVLSDLFGGGGGSNPFSAMGQNLSGGQGNTLAQNAMNSAASSTGSPLAPLQRNPVNMQNLQNLLVRKPMLGYAGRVT